MATTMSLPSGPDRSDTARLRAERRAFIRAAHPDTGGDPDAFVAGLAHFDGTRSVSAPRPSVYRSRRADRRVLHAIRRLRRRWSGRPVRRLE